MIETAVIMAGVDNEKALELTNSTVFHRGRDNGLTYVVSTCQINCSPDHIASNLEAFELEKSILTKIVCTL